MDYRLEVLYRQLTYDYRNKVAAVYNSTQYLKEKIKRCKIGKKMYRL